MKNLTSTILVLSLLAGIALAASFDGKWVSERKLERDGQSFTIRQTFDLKSDGGKLTGSITTAFGDQERTSDIKDGKVDGNKFSFHAIMAGPNGESKVVYQGAMEGDSLKGTSEREGSQSRPFEAKRK